VSNEDFETSDVSSSARDEKRGSEDQPGLVPENSGAHGRDGADPSDTAESDAELEQADQVPIESAEQVVEIVQAVLASRSESYTGLLPHPEHWGEFDAATQERILRMTESFTTDESSRRDRMVDSSISESQKGRQNAFVLMFLCVGAALAAQAWFSQLWLSIAFLSYPIFQAIGMFMPDVRPSKKSNTSEVEQ